MTLAEEDGYSMLVDGLTWANSSHNTMHYDLSSLGNLKPNIHSKIGTFLHHLEGRISSLVKKKK